ncbi:hypothetical protein AGMMS50230_11240 [Spirochaetia bacterium]|nr:hypothetical protein AGMMS50230_11240 [Spirochaetia bacterium]
MKIVSWNCSFENGGFTDAKFKEINEKLSQDGMKKFTLKTVLKTFFILVYEIVKILSDNLFLFCGIGYIVISVFSVSKILDINLLLLCCMCFIALYVLYLSLVTIMRNISCYAEMVARKTLNYLHDHFLSCAFFLFHFDLLKK